MKITTQIAKDREGKFLLAYQDPNTRKRIRKLFDTLPDANRAKAEIEQKQHELGNTNEVYVGHAIRCYLKENPNSLLVARRNSFLSFCETFNHYAVKDLSTEALRRWFDKIKEESKFTDKTLFCIKVNLNAFFKWLLKEKFIRENTLAPIRFKRMKSLTKPRTILSIKETKDMLAKLKLFSEAEVYPFIYTLVHTGARKSEIRNLTWDRLDFATGFITLMDTKNGRDRAIKMSDPLQAFLQEYYEQSSGENLFYCRKGNILSAWRIEDTLRRLQKSYPDMKKFTCHDIRHSFAFNFLKSGGQMYQLQAILGHASISLTVDLYGNLKACDVEKVSPFNF